MAASRVREMFEKGTDAFNRHDMEGMAETMADDVRATAPGTGELRGKAVVTAFYQSWIDAFPDARVEVRAAEITDDLAVEEGIFTGTHRATLHGPGGDIPATGRNVRVEYMQIARYRGDKVASFHLVFDRLEMLEQLGLAPSAETETPSRQPGELAGQGAQAPH